MADTTPTAASGQHSGAGDLSDTQVFYDRDARQKFSLLSEMRVERGATGDWDQLAYLHYKAEKRPLGPTYWRLMLGDRLIGVTILSIPRPLLKERHALMPAFKPGRDTKISNTARYDRINQHFAVCSRVVLDSMWRGCGASYRFVNIAARMSSKTFIEIQSAMSKYNQFAQRAGFTFAKPMRSPLYEPGLKLLRSLMASHPADIEALLEELAAMPAGVSRMTRDRLRKFYWKNSSMEQTGDSSNMKRIADRQAVIWDKISSMSDRELVVNFQQLVLASPLYGVYRNPDAGHALPAQIPLLAFDAQAPDQPLVALP